MTMLSKPTTATRVLICGADVGCGHGRAAAAITLALRNDWPDVQTRVIDALTQAPLWFKALYRDLYLIAAKHMPRLNGWLYDRTDIDGIPDSRGIGAFTEAYALRQFCLSDAVRDADLIICTHFLCARVLSRLRGSGEITARLAVVVTDQHPHAIWRAANIDLFIVPSDAAALELVRNGIGKERIAVTGIPIDSRFNGTINRLAARRRHDLPAESPIILLTGGGLGLGGIEKALDAIVNAPGGHIAVVVCGHNQALRQRLEKRYTTAHPRCRIIGLTSRMHELMAAADLLVGKPGGLTTSEAAALGLPMVLLRPLPGQEQRNATVLTSVGAAVLHEDPAIAGEVAVRLVCDRDALSRMSAAALCMGRRDSAHTAARAALNCLPSGVHAVEVAEAAAGPMTPGSLVHA